MSEVFRPCWHCDLCGHEWLKASADADPPEQCGRCKKRGWNRGPDLDMTAVRGPKRPKPTIPPTMVAAMADPPVGIPIAIAMCPEAYTAQGMNVSLNGQQMIVNMVKTGAGPMGWAAEFRHAEQTK